MTKAGKKKPAASPEADTAPGVSARAQGRGRYAWTAPPAATELEVPPPPVVVGSFEPNPPAAAAEWVPATELTVWPDNPKRPTKDESEGVARSIIRFGFGAPLVARMANRELIAGHTRLAACGLLPKLWAKADGAERQTWSSDAVRIANQKGAMLPVRLMDLDEHDAHILALADNELGADPEPELLLAQLEQLKAEERLLAGWSEKEFAKLRPVPKAGSEDVEDAPEPPADPVSKPGELYELGPHRLYCGDSTSAEALALLLGGETLDLLLTDPPYCSGGFQEGGKSVGSIGTRATVVDEKGKKQRPRIANDTLSTRGYQALIRRILELWSARFLYCFTDWRMWIPLFDVAEQSGFGVRSMIVWDKGTPGMGQGWRSEHELVLFGSKAKQQFDLRKSLGNVISAKRSGNDLHPTQKPIDLLEQIISVNDFAKTVGDPFGGSGSTLIAAARQGLTWRGCELSPGFCDVIRKRWGDYARANGIEPGAGAL